MMNWKNLVQGLLIAAMVLTPVLVTLSFVYIYADSTLEHFVPHYFPLDDLYYWRQIDTYTEVGWHGGYYVENENPAPASFSHFYAHGPFFSVTYGLLAKVVGWQPYSPVLFNLFFIVLAICIFIGALRLDRVQSLYGLLLVATSWPVLFYIMSGMQESFQQSLAILLAVLFYEAFRQRSAMPLWKRGAGVVFITLIALFRLTWIFLALPFLLITARRLTWRSLIVSLAVMVGLILVVSVVTTKYLYAPFPNYLTSLIQRQVSHDLGEGHPIEAIKNAFQLWSNQFRVNLDFAAKGVSLEKGQRVQIVFLILLFVGWLGLLIRRIRANKEEPSPRADLLEVGFHLFNLGFTLILVIAIYDMSAWRDYRVLAPHLLLSGMVLLACRRYRLLAVLLITNLALLIPFKNYYLAYGKAYLSHDRAAITRFEQTVDGLVVYNSSESNAWCNTLLINHHESYAAPLIGLPAGIGVTYYILPEQLDTPVKSRYLLLRPQGYEALRAGTRLEQLVATELGDLYLNLDAQCAAQPEIKEKN